jgi:hypothetical protein
MKRALAFVALLLSSAPIVHAASHRGWCGSVSGRAHDAVWAHREQEARRSGAQIRATNRNAASVYGQVAVLLDEGDLALQRNPLDLANQSVSFAPVTGGYRVARGAAPLFTDPGAPVALGDDDGREVALPFAFPFYGQRFDRAFLNSDGNLTFVQADAASTPRRIGRLVNGPPRIAPLLTDLDPSAGGAASVQSLGDRFVVTWRDIPNFESMVQNTVQAVLYVDGRIDFIYGTVNAGAEEGVAGIAPGQAQGGVLAVDFLSVNGESGGGAIAESFREAAELDEVAVARKYFQSFPDEVDQLVVFTNRRLVSSGTFAYARVVKNGISGIGEDIYDDAAEYGSGGRLETFVMMDTITKYPADPATVFLGGVDSALSVLAHETGHRWLARASFLEGGALSEALLGRQQAHWSFFMNSSASFLEGNEIQDLGGGQFRTTAASLRYGPLDQYMMGLRAAEEVPPFFYVANVVGTSDPARTPEPNVTLSGTRRDVSVGDIVAAIGPRSPQAGQTSTLLRQAYVFVAASGTSPAETDLAKVERLRAAFPAF